MVRGSSTKVSKFLRRFHITVFMKLILFCLAISFHTEKTSAARHKPSPNTERKQSVCYGKLGCFDQLSPFSPMMPLPMSPKKIQTEYYLRTRQNPSEDQVIAPEKQNLTESYFDPAKPTKIIIHGFVLVKSHLAKWVPEVTEAILRQDDVNVIQVNWVKGARVEYDNAASNTRVVGAQVAFLIKTLMEVRGARAADFHLIGFSLGAHVAGFAGKSVQIPRKGRKLGRITGLDPANPGFDFDSPKVRLDKSDAQFVDVIHTDTKTVFGMANGINRNLGHVDFYPNGGESQPGCHNWNKDWMQSVRDSAVCDHLRAPELFINSINATEAGHTMQAYKCHNYEKFKRGVCLRCHGHSPIHRGRNRCRQMGYWARPLHGRKNQVQYYLTTSDQAPFTVKHYQLQMHWRNHTHASRDGFKAKLFVKLHGANASSPEFSLNDGKTFHVVAGKTTRFLVTIDTEKDIGQVKRVTFRWEQPSCWNLFFNCHRENIRLKRIKIFDANEQKRYTFIPLHKNGKGRSTTREVQPDTPFEMVRRPYAAGFDHSNLVVPQIIPVHKKRDAVKKVPGKGAAATSVLSSLLAKRKPSSKAGS